MTIRKRLIGYGVTDNNGVANASYTGKGYGEIDVQAELKGKAVFIDKGLSGDGNHNDNWSYGENTSVTRGDNYTTISETGSTSAYWRANNNQAMTGDLCIEWDNHSTPNNQNYFLTYGTSDKAFRLDNYTPYAKCHMKVVIIGDKLSIYADGVAKLTDYTINRDGDGGVKFRFQLNDGANPFKYSNFVIYNPNDLLSDEKEILDCLFYDEATSNAKASQYNANTGLVLSYGNDGTTITCNESSGTRYYSTKINNNINWRDSNTNYHIEFDYSFADRDGGVCSIIFGNYRVSFSTIHNVATSGSGHLIIESNEDNYTITNGTFSRTYTMLNNDGFKFVIYTKGVITFKNLKVYPI